MIPFSVKTLSLVAILCLWAMAASAQVPSTPKVSGGKPNTNPHNKIKRWQWGGNVALLLGNPVLADVSPTLAYNLSRQFRIGAGVNYRYSFFKKNDSTTQVYGANAFVQFQPVPWFFVSGEYEGLNVPNPALAANGQENVPSRIWQQSPLLGGGIRFRLLRLLYVNVVLLRDFNYQKGISPYPSPWRFRMGFSL